MSVHRAAEGGPARHAAVLAGGASTRMGTPKATLEIAGRPLISYPLAAARAAGLETFVVAKRDSPLPELECPVVEEPDEPRHPLTGVIAALEHAAGPVVVLACDAPLVPAPLIAALASSPEPLAVPAHPRAQPLIARYSPSLLPRLRAALTGGESLTSLLEDLGGARLGEAELREFGDPEAMFANVNRPADAVALGRLGGRPDRR